MSQVQIQTPAGGESPARSLKEWWYEKRLGIEVLNDSVKFRVYTWGSCRHTHAEIVYPKLIDLMKFSSRTGSYEIALDIAKLTVENADSRKNINRAITIIPLSKLIVHYHGAISCGHTCNEYILLEPGKEPVAIEPITEIREEVNGKYTIIREYSYIVVDDKKIQVAVRELEKKKTKLVVRVEEVNGKVYVTGDTYDIKEELKSRGFRWDPQRKAWYIDKLSSLDVIEILKTLNVEVA